VLFIVNILTAVVTYSQNAKSEAIVDAFKNFIPPKTKVLRNGSYTTIDAAKVSFFFFRFLILSQNKIYFPMIL